MATWQKNRVIRFRSAATILETFGLPKDGRYYKCLIAGFERIFYSTFFFTSDEQSAETVLITRTSFRFVSTLKLWYIREERLNYCQRMREWRNAQEGPSARRAPPKCEGKTGVG